MTLHTYSLQEYTTIFSCIFLLKDISIVQAFTFTENTILYILINISCLLLVLSLCIFFFFSLIKTERRHGRENMTLTLHVIFSEASGSNPNWHISFMGQPLLMTYLLKYFHVYLYSPLSSRDPCIPATGPENGNSPPSVL